MNRITILRILVSILLIHTRCSAVEEEVKKSLVDFLAKLSGPSGQPDPSFGWNMTTDPCLDKWKGVACDIESNSLVKEILLARSRLSGVFDASSLCNVQPLAASLTVIKLVKNNIVGQLPPEIADCKNLSRLLIGHNRFSGSLPDRLPELSSLGKIDVSHNNFTGNLPDIIQISGLIVFLAQDNHLTGVLPDFNFSNFKQFNVSNNDFTGPVPDVNGHFDESSFLNNNQLCGPPSQNLCIFSKSSIDDGNDKGPGGNSKNHVLLYSGYGILGLVIVLAIIFFLVKKRKKSTKEKKHDYENKGASIDDDSQKPDAMVSDSRFVASRSEFSGVSAETELVSSSLIILTSPMVNGLRFDDLLSAPAELLGRGKHGSLYKVMMNNVLLAVKRIKDWPISSEEFEQRMKTIHKASHPNVLPPLAFYASPLENLLVYEYQENGSLSRFLHGAKTGAIFDWSKRLSVAARTAQALAFMHQQLFRHGIAHGNLKSSNIMLNKNLEPCISEYGLMVIESQDSSVPGKQKADNAARSDTFKADIYQFGVILFELLTGKQAQDNGIRLAKWVNSVVREEWTVEVFDKSLISEGASQERMLQLLQVAVKCSNQAPESRPQMKQVAVMINTIKEEEDRSVTYESMTETENTSTYTPM